MPSARSRTQAPRGGPERPDEEECGRGDRTRHGHGRGPALPRRAATGSTPTGGPPTTSRSARSTCSTTRSCASRSRPEHVKPRLLGHWGTTPGPQLHLRPHEPGDPELGPRRDLRHRARARRPGDRRQRLPRGDLQRGLPEHHPRRRGDAQAVPPVLVPGRHPQPRRARDAGLHPRGRRARLRALARLRRGLRQPGPRRLLRRRRRRGRDRPAGHELALEQVPQPGRATAPSCRSSTSTATRSPTRRSSPGSRRTSCAR